MREFFKRAAQEKSEQFRRNAEERVKSRQKLLNAIAAHHRELTERGIQLPGLERYTDECLNLVTDHRRLHDIETPAEAANLTGNARKKLMRDFRKEKRDSERILRIMSGDLGFPTVRDMIYTIRTEISARRRLKK